MLNVYASTTYTCVFVYIYKHKIYKCYVLLYIAISTLALYPSLWMNHKKTEIYIILFTAVYQKLAGLSPHPKILDGSTDFGHVLEDQT